MTEENKMIMVRVRIGDFLSEPISVPEFDPGETPNLYLSYEWIEPVETVGTDKLKSVEVIFFEPSE